MTYLDRLVFFIAALLVGCVLLAAPRNGSALTLTEVIAATQNVYDKTNDLKADFIQETTIKSINKTEREEGVFYFKKPHRMVWAYTKPKDKKMVINPQTAWLYLPVDNVVYIQNATDVFKGKAIIRFLSGWGKLTEDFTVTFASPEGIDRSGNFHLRLAPREQDFGVTAFFLILDKSKFQITQLNFTDSYGNTTRLSFRNIRVNINLPEKFFTFTPPAGVEIQR